MSSFTESLESAHGHITNFLQKRTASIKKLTDERRFATVNLDQYTIGCFFGIDTGCDHHTENAELITSDGPKEIDLSKAFVIGAEIEGDSVLLKIVHPSFPALHTQDRLPVIFVNVSCRARGDDA